MSKKQISQLDLIMEFLRQTQNATFRTLRLWIG